MASSLNWGGGYQYAVNKFSASDRKFGPVLGITPDIFVKL
jgi:hypothetical protein